MTAMALMIDTLKFADAFERGGFAPQQARTLATALADAQAVSVEDLATKQDLSSLEGTLKQDLSSTEEALKQDIGLLKRDLETAVGGLKRDIAELDRKFSADLGVQIARSELAAERRSNRLMLAIVVLVPILSKAVDLVSRHYGL